MESFSAICRMFFYKLMKTNFIAPLLNSYNWWNCTFRKHQFLPHWSGTYENERNPAVQAASALFISDFTCKEALLGYKNDNTASE